MVMKAMLMHVQILDNIDQSLSSQLTVTVSVVGVDISRVILIAGRKLIDLAKNVRS